MMRLQPAASPGWTRPTALCSGTRLDSPRAPESRHRAAGGGRRVASPPRGGGDGWRRWEPPARLPEPHTRLLASSPGSVRSLFSQTSEGLMKDHERVNRELWDRQSDEYQAGHGVQI